MRTRSIDVAPGAHGAPYEERSFQFESRAVDSTGRVRRAYRAYRVMPA